MINGGRFTKSLQIYREPAAVRMFFLGFSAGLPLLLVLGTLSFWMRESGVDLKTIGFMSWVGLCWGLKWLWAPLVDRLPIPILTRVLGRRRAWLLIAQLGLVISIASMAFCDPVENIQHVALLSLITAFFGATQDIALDAYRIESGAEDRQAAFAATYQTGYRLAMIWSGAGALAIAAAAEAAGGAPWRTAYLVMAGSFSVGIMTVLCSPEPDTKYVLGRLEWSIAGVRQWLYKAACEPFIEFFSRFGWWAIAVLALIATYRISDVVMGVMANPFYQDLGFLSRKSRQSVRFLASS